MTDETDQTDKDRWWKRVLDEVRATEGQAASTPRLVVSNHLPEPTDAQVEGIRKIFARVIFERKFKLLPPNHAGDDR